MAVPLLIPGAATEPVPVDSAREWLRQPDQPADVDTIRGVLRAAREWVEAASGLSLAVSTWEIRLPTFPGYLELPYPPLASVESVQYLLDGTLEDVDAAVYVVTTSVVTNDDDDDVTATSSAPGTISLADGQTWPAHDTHPEAVRIRFVSGAAADAVPETAKQAIKMLAHHWYVNRTGFDDIPAGVQHLAWTLGGYRF